MEDVLCSECSITNMRYKIIIFILSHRKECSQNLEESKRTSPFSHSSNVTGTKTKILKFVIQTKEVDFF